MIYFDHAATTPIDPDVQEIIKKSLSERWGNPSSIYNLGREAKAALEDARARAAEIIGATRPTEIIFTSGATESNNMAIKGVMEAAAHTIGAAPHVITTQIEHHCVLDTVKYLELNFGAEATYLSVDREGLVDPKEVVAAIRDNTALVSVMMGNNEVGSLEPIAEIGKEIKKINEKRLASGNNLMVRFHTDAVQAFAFVETKVEDLDVDLLSLTGHKFYGPKGVGLLYVKSGTKLVHQQLGGAQERGLRAGTENLAYIEGLVSAMDLAEKNRSNYHQEVAEITDYLINRVTIEIEDVELLGPQNVKYRLPHIANFIFKRIEGESILINLDMLGIAASSGSACTSGSLEPSHVTRAMGFNDLDSHGAVRFSIGKLNKKEDVDELMKHLPGIIEKLRAMSPIK